MSRDRSDRFQRLAAPSEERRELRSHFRRKRRRLDPAGARQHALAVSRLLLASPLLWRSRCIGIYLGNDGELDTAPLIDRLLRMGKRLALPVVGGNGVGHRRMDFFRLGHDTRLVANRFGIAEPAPGAPYVAPLSIDLLLVPLVAFDDFGMRLGMGAGFYDRFLGRLAPALRPRLVGLAHEVQHSLDPLPFDDWDVPLQAVVTERGWYEFDERCD